MAKTATLPFFTELKQFWRFIKKPKPGAKLPGHKTVPGSWDDFCLNISIGRILQWALLLWLVNIFVFAPMALVAAEASGAQHRMDINNLPWLTALIWAPIVEELTFRYVLRRPAIIWWFIPLMVAVLVQGPGISQSILLALAISLALAPLYFKQHRLAFAWRLSWRTRLNVIRLYPLFFHAVALMFAGVHLFNFKFASLPLAILPLLVIPQWFTGLVLGWFRVKRGIMSAIVLHAVFNGGPLLLIGLALHYMPELVLAAWF